MEFTHLSFKYAPHSCSLCVQITLRLSFPDYSAFLHRYSLGLLPCPACALALMCRLTCRTFTRDDAWGLRPPHHALCIPATQWPHHHIALLSLQSNLRSLTLQIESVTLGMHPSS